MDAPQRRTTAGLHGTLCVTTMNIGQHPELLDKLAANYALGTLKGGAKRRFEAYARQSATVRTSALLWQERMSAMTELATPAQPHPNVWKRIENSLAAAMPVSSHAHGLLETAAERLRRTLSLWRGAALVGCAAMIAAVAIGIQTNRSLDAQTQEASALKDKVAALSATHQVQYVAVLADDKAAASVLVTFDPGKQRLVLQRVGSFDEGETKSLQLWAIPASGAPESLGVIGKDKVLKLTSLPDQVQKASVLAVSLEPKGGVPSATGPTGPVLFKGALLQTAL
jgi:anti-sigma-K factor RskA